MPVFLAVLTALYFVSTCLHAAREKFWYDEVLTFDAASLLPAFKPFWTFLTRFEASPPLFFALSAASEKLFGANELGVRFPSVLGFWVMGACLYIFLGRRLPKTFAVAAVLLAALTAAGRYSYEARPYALMLGLAGIALVAWQAAAENRHRRIALPALALALTAALCSHSMAVTLALPFALGETVRTWQRKRLDWPVWTAFAASAPAVGVLWKIKNARDFTAIARFSGSIPHHIVTTYADMLKPAALPLGLALFLALVLRFQAKHGEAPRATLRVYEYAALWGFAAIPFVAVPFSTLSGHYWMRYAINCTPGLAALCVLLLFRLSGANRMSGAAVAGVFVACFAIVQFLPEDRRPDAGMKIENSSADIQPFLDRIPHDAPIVICNDLTFVELEHYVDPRLASRLYYLTDRAAAESIDGDIGFEVDGWLLGKFFPFHANFADYHAFIATHKRFYVVQPIRNIVLEYLAKRIDLQPREIAGQFQYWVATPL